MPRRWSGCGRCPARRVDERGDAIARLRDGASPRPSGTPLHRLRMERGLLRERDHDPAGDGRRSLVGRA
jgi:hypothetical protein